MHMSKNILCGTLFIMTAGAYALDAGNLPYKTVEEAKAINPSFSISDSLLRTDQAKQVRLEGGLQVEVPRATVGKVVDAHALKARYLFVRQADFPIIFTAFNKMGHTKISASKAADVAAWTPVVTTAQQGYIIDSDPFGFNNGWVDGDTLTPAAIVYLNNNMSVLSQYLLIKDNTTGAQSRLEGSLTPENLKGKKVGYFDCPAC